MSEIPARRLAAHRLVGTPFETAVEAVGRLGAVQSQDYGAAKWALAQRLGECGEAELDALFDAGAILRTHVMRPTWHFVLPEDVGWMLELTSPRLLAGMAGPLRRLELDPATVDRAVDLIAEALAGGRHLTRAELESVLAAGGIPGAGRMAHLLGVAEMRGVIVSGPRRGRQFTWALFSERAPRGRRLDREEALVELVRRYFRSHCPAQVRDFAWWSGLTVAETRAGLELAGADLARETIEGKEYWFDPGAAGAGGEGAAVHLLPNFDEFTVAYRDRSALLDPRLGFDPGLFSYFQEAAPESGLLSNVVTFDGRVRGAWRRTLTQGSLRVEVRLLEASAAIEVGIERAVERLGRFLGRRPSLRVETRGPLV